MTSVRVSCAQTPEFLDDVSGAMDFLIDMSARSQAQGACLLVFPEGYLQGYTPAEHDARRVAIDLSSRDFEDILSRFPKTGPTIVVGLIEAEDGKLFNTAVVVRRGELHGRYRKMHLLAAEGAFTPGTLCPAFDVEGLRFGVNICYDTNFPEAARRVEEAGASLIVCCANNMLVRNRSEAYRQIHNAERAKRCRETGLWLISSDVTGARGNRVSWGPTAVLSPAGEVVAQLPLDRPGLLTFDIPLEVRPTSICRTAYK